jgi:hypothetical protein
MKKTLSLIALIFLSLITFSKEIKIHISTKEEIKSGNYCFYNSKNGELMIPYIYEINSPIEIISLKYDYMHEEAINLPKIKKNPDYSTSSVDSIINETPNIHIMMTNGNSGSSTNLIFQYFPVIYSDSIPDVTSEVEITIAYNEIIYEGKSSIFDKGFSNAGTKSSTEKTLADSATLDMVIITSERFSDSLSKFCEFENLMGIKTLIKTVEEIYSHFSGSDKQEKIRNYIKEQYLMKGIRFVLLAGEDEIVPIRMSYSTLYYHYGYVPTDLYYADMNGTWNADKDGLVGEIISDIEDGFPDINVSRLPFENEIELKNLLQKFYGYVCKSSPEKINTFLHAGASLLTNLTDGSGQLMTDMLVSMNGMDKYSHERLFSPISDNFNYPPSYSGDMQLNRSSFISEISKGYHFINHIDHSSEYYLGTGNLETKTEYNSQDTIFLSNSDSVYSIMFSMGCFANGFDRESASDGLLLSMRSSIINFVGFTRTGWTSSQALMNRYWAMMADSGTNYTGEAFRFAMIENNLYFRVAINMTGFSTMPVYSQAPDSFFVALSDTIFSSDSIILSIRDSHGAVSGATVVLMDSINYLRIKTDASGKAKISPFSLLGMASIGISKKNHIPYVDSFYVKGQSLITIEDISIIDNKYISLNIVNSSDSIINFSHIHFGANDSMFFFNKDIFNISFTPNVSQAVVCTLYYFKRPAHNAVKKIGYDAETDNLSFSDSAFVSIEKTEFKVNAIEFDQTEPPFISSLAVSKSNALRTADVSVKISSLSPDITVLDSIFTYEYFEDSILIVSDIKLRKNDASADFRNNTYRVIVNFALRSDTIDVSGLPADVELNLFTSLQTNSISVYTSQTIFRTDIYRADFSSSDFALIYSLKAGEILFSDTSATIGINQYYAVFYDNLGRIIDTSETVRANLYAKTELSDVHSSGSFYGSLDGKRYYARSSFNSADLNNDGAKEMVFVSDDGRFYILDSNLNDITPFTLFTTPHHETTPSIGDIDRDGFLDIVIGNGSFASDTTAFVIFNPMSANRRIEPVCSLGVLTASSVIANIDADYYNEIILGTSKGLYVLKSNLRRVDYFTKQITNVWGIAISEEQSMLFINDYYGNIYSYDFSGNARSGFPYKTAHVTLTPLILTDIDCNTKLDVVIGTAGGYLYVIDQDGNVRNGFPYACLSGIYHTPRLFDINNDHNIEIIFSDINGNIYVMNNSGVRVSYCYTGDPTNTYNEILIYDFNGDMKEEFVFVMRSGKIAVYNQELIPLFSQFIKLENMVTSCPIAVDFYGDMKPVLIIRDYAGQIYKLNSYSNSSSVGKISFSKTLYDSRNTSFVNGFLLKSENEDTIHVMKEKKNSVLIKNAINNKMLAFAYKSGIEGLSVMLFNKLGQVVSEFILPEKREYYEKDLGKLSSGEYFVTVSDKKETLLREKILIVK